MELRDLPPMLRKYFRPVSTKPGRRAPAPAPAPGVTSAGDSEAEGGSLTYGRTPLHRAAWLGDSASVASLLGSLDSAAKNVQVCVIFISKHIIDNSAEDAWGRSPLWCAVTRGQVAAVRQLLADPEVAVAGLDSYGKDLATR